MPSQKPSHEEAMLHTARQSLPAGITYSVRVFIVKVRNGVPELLIVRPHCYSSRVLGKWFVPSGYLKHTQNSLNDVLDATNGECFVRSSTSTRRMVEVKAYQQRSYYTLDITVIVGTSGHSCASTRRDCDFWWLRPAELNSFRSSFTTYDWQSVVSVLRKAQSSSKYCQRSWQPRDAVFRR